MREVDFLPDWYRVLHVRKRWLKLQSMLTVAVLMALALWQFQAGRNVRADEAALASIKGLIVQAEGDVNRLDTLLDLQKRWKQQDQIIARLGVGVDSTRLVSTIESLMPPEMSLLDLSLDTKEQSQQIAGLARMRAVLSEQQELVDRTLVVRMHGVAPTDNHLANFHGKLSSVPFFNNVDLSYARDKQVKGYVMREFEITFNLNLNAGEAN